MSDHAALAALAAHEWALAEPEFLRTGVNSLFAAGDDVVLRVGTPPFGSAAELAWASTMSRIGVRVPAIRDDVIERDGVSVMALERIHPQGSVDWREVGAMIRRVHLLDVDEFPDLPWCGDFPHWQVETLLADVAGDIDAPALAGIEECLDRWQGWRDRMRWSLVVCHGDVHPGNVIPGRDGPVLIDWDLRCVGPMQWDHGPLLQWSDRWTDRWGGGPNAYAEFAAGYGGSMRGDWLGDALGAMRMVIATLMRVRAARTDPAAAVEAGRRLCFWRGEPDAPLWEPQ